MHEVLGNRLGGLSLPRKSVVRLTDHLDMTLDVYCGCKITTQPQLLIESCVVKQYHLVTFSNIGEEVNNGLNGKPKTQCSFYRKEVPLK